MENSIFIGSWNNGLIQFNLTTKTFSNVGIYNPQWGQFTQPYYRLAFRDSKDNFYLTLDGFGIFQSNSGSFWGDFNFNELKKEEIESIAENRKGILFVGTVHNGVYRASKKTVTKVKKAFETASSFKLEQNFPNPFNPTTTINYSIPAFKARNAASLTKIVTLKIYDVLGREIKTLVNKQQTPGNYSVKFNAANLPSGVYFYRLRAGDFVKIKKMVLLK
jgi:hypothetical protein